MKDHNDEPLGVLLVGKELFSVNRFLSKFHITQREWETIQYMILGMTNREIAKFMNVSERTVKAHIAHIYNKIKKHSPKYLRGYKSGILQFTRMCYENGLDLKVLRLKVIDR